MKPKKNALSQKTSSSALYKELADGNLVSQKVYHILLDYNDQTDKKFMISKFDKNRLCDLTINEFNRLHAEYKLWYLNKVIEPNQKSVENKTE
jgi:hypothetical protein